MSNEAVLIGVDGGASEVRGHEVVPLPRSSLLEPLSFGLGAASASNSYDRARGFRPLPLPTQLLAFDLARIEVTGIEGAQGRLWLEAASQVILAVASQAGAKRARVGICMPGLKTRDGRGIAVIRHGPRIPDYVDRLEPMLAAGGLELTHPLARLSSDGEACAHGEDASAHGALRGIESAYYIGGGTGIAEALKIEGRVFGFDALRGFLKKAWQMETGGGKTVEDLLSPRGMNAAYAQVTRQKLPLDAASFPEKRAAEGDEGARDVLRQAADGLADLVLDRMQALRRGSGGPPSTAGRAQSTPKAPPISPDLRIRANTILDRVVVGQRLGLILADPSLFEVFRAPAEEALARRIIASGDGALRKHYLEGSSLRPSFLVPSLLRAAPAIGAAAIEVLEAERSIEPSRATPSPPF